MSTTAGIVDLAQVVSDAALGFVDVSGTEVSAGSIFTVECRHALSAATWWASERALTHRASSGGGVKVRAHLHSLQVLLSRWCSQMLDPLQSLHLLRMRWCSQMLDPPHSLQSLLWGLVSKMVDTCIPCIGSFGAGARTCSIPCSPCIASLCAGARRCSIPRIPCICS